MLGRTLALLALTFTTGCGSSGPCRDGALERWPGPWEGVALPSSETAGVCRASATELQHLRVGGSVKPVLTETEAALKADGWSPEPRAKNETAPDGAETRSWVKGDSMVEVAVNRAATEDLTVVSFYDVSDKKPYTAKLPEDWEARMAAGREAMASAKAALAGANTQTKACPKDVSAGPYVDWRMLVDDKGSYDLASPSHNGGEYDRAVKSSTETDDGKDSWLRFYDPLTARGLVAIRVTAHAGAGVGAGTGVFSGGSARGMAYVVQDGKITCQVPWTAESSEVITEGEQANDLRRNVFAAVSAAIRG